jgi:hypothetical protein
VTARTAARLAWSLWALAMVLEVAAIVLWLGNHPVLLSRFGSTVAVKPGETPGGHLVCMSASGVGWLIQATVGSLGGVGGRANRCGLAA